MRSEEMVFQISGKEKKGSYDVFACMCLSLTKINRERRKENCDECVDMLKWQSEERENCAIL